METVDMASSYANAAKECGAHSYDMESSPILIGDCAPILERREWRQKKITALGSKAFSMLSLPHADATSIPQYSRKPPAADSRILVYFVAFGRHNATEQLFCGI
jgi:hypothetical protein